MYTNSTEEDKRGRTTKPNITYISSLKNKARPGRENRTRDLALTGHLVYQGVQEKNVRKEKRKKK
jgi:hypothetical protein